MCRTGEQLSRRVGNNFKIDTVALNNLARALAFKRTQELERFLPQLLPAEPTLQRGEGYWPACVAVRKSTRERMPQRTSQSSAERQRGSL
jgi:hypothetical protein